ncbi:hypothetical protein U8V72_26775 [Priestia filamentosa]|uniref:hypothetical protein n=1 Tax=Priestia filamentosa TaxID=1402861 RepID=UPI00397B8D7C
MTIKEEVSINRWNLVEQNKWGLKISENNYMFVIIHSLENEKYELTYIDANIEGYNRQERNMVCEKYSIGNDEKGLLALKLMEYFEHYEWKETLNSQDELINKILNEIPFPIALL